MRVLFKSVTVICSRSPFNNSKKDILIEDEYIISIEDAISANNQDKVVDHPGLCASLGWFDIGTRICDPGLEFKEDLNSALKAGVKGGYTGLACHPATKPIIQTKDLVHSLLARAKSSIVDLHVIASATEGQLGKSMTEIVDLHAAGAIAFSDGGEGIEDSSLLIKLIQYTGQINGVLMVQCEEKSLTKSGTMHEGKASVFLGLKGIPSVSEEIMVARNLALLDYARGCIHFSKLSSAGAVDLVRNAKALGLKVTCDVAVANLVFTENDLLDFDTNFKVNPPLRCKSDQIALWKALADNTIDAIITDHDPQDEESKKVEFDQAELGMIQLETAYALLNEHYSEYITIETLIEKISDSPRSLLNLEIDEIKVGAKANLTLFDPSYDWIFDEKVVASKSKNSPVLGKQIKGKVLAVYNKGQFIDFR